MSLTVTRSGDSKIELQMTPMIDIVFQLLVFFIMTFKIVVPEGDFNVKMPLTAPADAPDIENSLPPIMVRLTADRSGELSGIRLNGAALNDFDQLRGEIVRLLGKKRGQGSFAEAAEVELDCDYQLDYKYVIRAISAVSGYLGPDRQVVTLVERIKFAPPRSPL